MRFIKNWALPLAMITGVLTYPWVSYLSFTTPGLIFVMLLLTFSKLSPREIRIHPAHGWLLLIQIAGSIGVYFLLQPFHPIIAQGALICMLVPTATSAAVITGMLGGNVAFLTTYLLLCNICVVIIAPILFSWIGPQQEMPFFESFLFICRQVGPVLLLPLFIAWIVRYTWPAAHKVILGIRGLSFYLWAIALTIVTGSTMKFLVGQETPDYRVEAGLAVVAFFICAGQFLLGRRIGRRYGDPVSSGQGLGQKNTILAIWMAQSYLVPISSMAPAAYVLWQNCVNSYQLWLKARRENKRRLLQKSRENNNPIK